MRDVRAIPTLPDIVPAFAKTQELWPEARSRKAEVRQRPDTARDIAKPKNSKTYEVLTTGDFLEKCEREIAIII
jgi:hypothetical protein